MTMVPYSSSQNGNKHHHHQQQDRSTDNNYAFYTASAMNQVVQVEGYNYNINNNNNCFFLGSDHFVVRHMAEEDESSSRANTNTNSTTHIEQQQQQQQQPELAEPAGSTLKEQEPEQRGINNNNSSSNWLQLSIGFHHHHPQGISDHHDAAATATTTTTKHDHDHHHHLHQQQPGSSSSGSHLVELELLPSGGVRHLNYWGGSSSRPSLLEQQQQQALFPLASSSSSEIIRGSTIIRTSCQGASSSSSSLLFEQTSMSMPCGPISATTFGYQQPQEMVNWAFGPLPHSMAIMPSPHPSFVSSSSPSQSCTSLRPHHPIGSYFPTPFHHFPSSGGFDQFDVAGPSSHHDVTVRVVDPPRRPHSGIWFMLQASQNQAKEPFLPQIPKSYLRIKDGRMTVRLLLKYLVSKLRLESESEIEITCKGQQLLPFLTLQHVRDNIWTPRDTNNTRALLSDSSTTDHVMVLHYGRSTS